VVLCDGMCAPTVAGIVGGVFALIAGCGIIARRRAATVRAAAGREAARAMIEPCEQKSANAYIDI